MWQVLYLPDAEAERQKLAATERAAIDHAVVKLEEIGSALGFPQSSAVQAVSGGLRELRPRRGRSPYRAIYRRVKDVFVIAAICPEAIKDPKGFRRGCAIALERLAELDETAEEE
jgi:mRNA-degrading endonuclease RelE of RelBE toxin-antitoxin system